MLYRCYFLNEQNRISGPAKVIDCVDDETAVATAQCFLERDAIEIWDRTRRIVRLEPRLSRERRQLGSVLRRG